MHMTTQRTGGAIIADALVDAGFLGVAAYVGTSELALCDAILGTGQLELVNARGDSQAVFLASGANYASPDRYAALLHGARGLTNALGAIADGRRSERSALCLVGMASRQSAPFLPPHHEPDLISGAGCFAKAWFDTSTLEYGDGTAIHDTVRAALQACMSAPYGPVLLGVPQDVAAATYHLPRQYRTPFKVETLQTDLAAIRQAVARIKQAKTPVIFVDDAGLGTAEIEPALSSLAETLGAPVFQVAYQRGPMLFRQLRRAAVPTLHGPYQPQNAQHREIVSAADLILTIEDRNMYQRVVGPLPLVPRIAVTSHPVATFKNGYEEQRDVILHGRCAALVAALVQGLPKRSTSTATMEWSQSVSRANHPAARQLAQAIGDGFGVAKAPRVLVDDSQMLGGLIAQNYDSLPACQVIGSHGGFVGSGLATAAGVALGTPSAQVLCLLGDQGFTNAVQALSVIAERNLNITVIVCNNGTSVSLLKQRTTEANIPDALSRFLRNNDNMDYAAIAAGFGLPVQQLTFAIEQEHNDAQVLRQTIAASMAARGPSFVELVTPSDPAFWSGVWTTTGFEV